MHSIIISLFINHNGNNNDNYTDNYIVKGNNNDTNANSGDNQTNYEINDTVPVLGATSLWPLLTVYGAPFKDFYLLLEESPKADGEGDPEEVVDIEQCVQKGDAGRYCNARAAEEHVCSSGDAGTLRCSDQSPLLRHH